MAGIGLINFFERYKDDTIHVRFKMLNLELKYAWQRVLYGYDNRDVFDFNYTFIKRTTTILNEYKKNKACLWVVPKEYESKNIGTYDYNVNCYILNSKQTDSIIECMIFHLQMSDEDFVIDKLYKEKYLSDSFTYTDYERIYHITRQNKEAFMKLFSLFFYQIWD